MRKGVLETERLAKTTYTAQQHYIAMSHSSLPQNIGEAGKVHLETESDVASFDVSKERSLTRKCVCSLGLHTSLIVTLLLVTLLLMSLTETANQKTRRMTEFAHWKYGTCAATTPPVLTSMRDIVPASAVEPTTGTNDTCTDCDMARPCCPNIAGQVLRKMTYDHQPDGVEWLYRPPPYIGYESHSLVPVLHCRFEYERNGAWFYVARGSAVAVNVGRTKVFDTHEQAVWHFLRAFRVAESLHEALSKAASARGYDSVQFVKHADMRCGHTAHEILMTRFAGNSSCPGPLISTLDNQTCECDNEAPCASCNGRVVLT